MYIYWLCLLICAIKLKYTMLPARKNFKIQRKGQSVQQKIDKFKEINGKQLINGQIFKKLRPDFKKMLSYSNHNQGRNPRSTFQHSKKPRLTMGKKNAALQFQLNKMRRQVVYLQPLQLNFSQSPDRSKNIQQSNPVIQKKNQGKFNNFTIKTKSLHLSQSRNNNNMIFNDKAIANPQLRPQIQQMKKNVRPKQQLKGILQNCDDDFWQFILTQKRQLTPAHLQQIQSTIQHQLEKFNDQQTYFQQKITILNNLALFYAQRVSSEQMKSKTEQIYETIMRLSQKYYSKNDERSIMAKNNLACYMFEMGRVQKGKKLFKECQISLQKRIDQKLSILIKDNMNHYLKNSKE